MREGMLETELLGRVLDQMCQTKGIDANNEWERLKQVIVDMINANTKHFRIGISDEYDPTNITHREQVERLLSIAKIIGV